ncbi:hypothetical protein ACFJX1_07775 [Enterococcus faecalis]|nr:membrane lipoprotein lipid attachment site-containing protein [Enterococcus faecalis]
MKKIIISFVLVVILTGCGQKQVTETKNNTASSEIKSKTTTKNSAKESQSTDESITEAFKKSQFTKQEQSAIDAANLIANDFSSKIAGKWSGSIRVFQMIGSRPSDEFTFTLNFSDGSLDMTEKSDSSDFPTDIVYDYQYKVDVNALASTLLSYTDDFSDISDYESLVANYSKYSSTIGYLPIIFTGSNSGVYDGKSVTNSNVSYELNLAYKDLSLVPLSVRGLFNVDTPSKFTRN